MGRSANTEVVGKFVKFGLIRRHAEVERDNCAGLMMHATILAYMFSLVEMNRITVPLRPDITAIQNMAYVQEFMANLLKAAFPHLNE